MIYYECNYFEELEGIFGESITSQYLRQHDMENWANELDFYNLYISIYKSYMLYLSDIIFYTSKKGVFKPKEATKLIVDETPFKDTYIDIENIPEIVRLNGFKTITDLIDYMVCLEISKKHSPEDQFMIIKQLCKKEDYDFYNYIMRALFDFYYDNNKQLSEEKNILDKKIRVLK